MPVTILSGVFPNKEMTPASGDHPNDISQDTHTSHVAPFFLQPDELSTLLHYSVADARPKCALFRRPERTLLLAVEREGGEGEGSEGRENEEAKLAA